MMDAFAIKIRQSPEDSYVYYHIKCYASGRRDVNRSNFFLFGKKFSSKKCSGCGRAINENPRDFLEHSKCQKKDCVHKYSDGRRCAMYFFSDEDHYVYCNYIKGRKGYVVQ